MIIHAFTSFGVTVEYTAIWSYTPEKAGCKDTQLSPANPGRQRFKNEKYIYVNTCLVLATRLRSCQDLPAPLGICLCREKGGILAYSVTLLKFRHTLISRISRF